MDKKKYYTNMFLCAAIWNWMVGLSLLLLSFVMPELFLFFGVEIPPSLVFVQMLFVLIVIFGFGFFFVHLNVDENHGIVQMSALEKLMFFLVFFIYFIIGDVNIFVLLLNIVDLIFGMLFIEFLWCEKSI